MLMAAGLGTRMRPFTELEPKALLPVMGIPCAQFAVDSAVIAGVDSLVANVSHLADRASEGLMSLERGAATLTISDERSLLLGSAGGIAKALPHFGNQAFFLLNADVLCDVDLRALAATHQRLRDRYGVRLTLTVFEKPAGSGAYREIMLDQETGLIQGFGEVTRGRPYFVGAAVIEPEALNGISPDQPSEFVAKILEPAIRDRKAGFFLTGGKWFDVGTPELWRETHSELMKALETGDISRAWRLRIEAENKRVGQEMWIGKQVSRFFQTADWQEPAYFNDLRDSTARPPREFGPGAVLYGSAPEVRGRFENRVSFRGLQALKQRSASSALE